MKLANKPLLSWLSLAVLVVVVCVLGVVQYRWIGEISEIQQRKLVDYLQNSLNEVSREFNSELSTACAALMPKDAEVSEFGREGAYERRFAQWKNSTDTGGLFSRVALVWEQDGQLALRMLDTGSGRFAGADWPPGWSGIKDRITSRLRRGPDGGGGPQGFRGPGGPADLSTVIDMPRFGDSGRGGRPGRSAEQDWLLVEVDSGYAAGGILPEQLTRHFGSTYQADYQISLVARANPGVTIYQSEAPQRSTRPSEPVASVYLFDVTPQNSFRGGPGPGRGRWQLSIRLNAGSLETVVARARQRNLAISAALLLVLLLTAGALVRFSRQAQRLAAIEMEFVAGVSHELRTPLTVIRTAAYNLRGKLAANPAQVERYGTLIQQESEKLTAIVEQVLQFATAKSGRIIRERAPLSVESLIEDSLQSSKGILERTSCQVEKQVEPGLPPVLGDPMALRHALQNLIDNAVKYGTEGSKWIGVYAGRVAGAHAAMIEIRVADRGPGIPRAEQHQIFDAFFRGKQAIGDQIHGTGLGLNLVKQTIEAHGGTVQVESEPGAGTTFIVRLPTGPIEQLDDFARSAG